MERFKIKTNRKKALLHPHNDQRNNEFSPSSACNVTALQVALSLDNDITDDGLFKLCNSKEIWDIIKAKYPNDKWIIPFFERGNANEVWVVLVEVAIKVVGDSKYVRYHQFLSKELIIKEIDNGYPVVVCGNFTKGHFVAIVGYDLDKQVWIVNDSWGNWNTNYVNKNGNNVEYSMSKLEIGSFLRRMSILVHADKRIPA